MFFTALLLTKNETTTFVSPNYKINDLTQLRDHFSCLNYVFLLRNISLKNHLF